MNSSQLLYRISNLQYSIRRKQVEYGNAVKTNDQLDIKLSKETLILLKQDLAASVEEFNALPPDNMNKKFKEPKRRHRWLSFFNLKSAINKK